MKITATKENLAKALARANCAIGARLVVPIMANVLLEAMGDRLNITASSSEIVISTWIPALVEEEGATTVPAKYLAQIVNSFPNSDVSLQSDEDDTMLLKCSKITTRIHGMNAIDFPKPNEMTYDWSFEIKVKDLFRGLKKVAYAKSTDESRKQLNGVVFSIRSGMLTLAATDGRRLAIQEIQLDDPEAKDGDYILPSLASAQLASCLDPDCEKVVISLNKSIISFESPNTVLRTKLVEGVYPNFRQVIPENWLHAVVIARTSLMEALSRISIVVADNSGSVKLTFSRNQLDIFAASPEKGESTESMEIAYDGDEVSVSFNPMYFNEPLKTLEADNVTIQFGKQYDPIRLMGDEGFLYMLMPMRG